jgi:hypothetical protein
LRARPTASTRACGDVVGARPGPRDLAARPTDPPRTRAGPLPPASGASPLDAEEPHPRSLVAFGHPCPVSDLFGVAGRQLLDRLELPDPWRSNIDISLAVTDDLDQRINDLTAQIKRHGADHRYIPTLLTAPGGGWINAFTIASEIGDITRFPRPRSSVATPACAPGSVSPAPSTRAARSASTAPSTCAGRCSRPP